MKPAKSFQLNKEIFCQGLGIKLKGGVPAGSAMKLFVSDPGVVVETKGRRVVIPWIHVDSAELVVSSDEPAHTAPVREELVPAPQPGVRDPAAAASLLPPSKETIEGLRAKKAARPKSNME